MAADTAKTALITGASSGIGYELAKLFARDGFELVLVSRDAERLEKAAASLEAPRITVIRKDLTAADAPDEVFGSLRDDAITIDALVNNAGVGINGPFHKSDSQRVIDLVQLNVTALVHLTRLVLPGMIERRSGRILNVGSVAAYQPGPYMATYYASKAFVLSFSEAIATELEGTGVTMTTLSPGPTETPFHDRAGIKRSPLSKGNVRLSAESVARIGYDAMMKGKRSVVTGLKYRIAAFMMSRILPKSVVLKGIAALNKNR